MTSNGGCVCGAVRFSSIAEPVDAGYCHCKLCQRSTGAPVLAWVSYPTAGFSYNHGEPARYQSTKHGHREFCSACGTQIAYRDSQDAATVDVNVGSLDDCDQVQPRYHIWCASRIPWFDIADNLPRYEGSKPKNDET
jgi:hypothetical protein